MSAPQQTPSGQSSPDASQDVIDKQFEDGSLDKFVSGFAHICHVEPPELDLTRWLGRQAIGKCSPSNYQRIDTSTL